MEIQIKIHVGDDLYESKEVIERLVEENISKKLDHYLKKFNKPDAEGIIEVFADKNKKWLFDAKLIANLDGQDFIYKREDYKHLDDVINHIFEHFKEALSK